MQDDTIEVGSAPKGIAATLARHALQSGRAVVVGNRAGVVEWANPAWTRMTGFPMAETISKPITHFLHAAEIEFDLVEFVGHQFLEGRSSTVEFPFQTFDHRAIWVHLEVEPIRDLYGEITEFVAVATDITERHLAAQSENEAGHDEPDAQQSVLIEEAIELQRSARVEEAGSAGTSMRAEVERALESVRAPAGSAIQFDIALDEDAALNQTATPLFREIARQLLIAATRTSDSGWSTVSISSGSRPRSASFASDVHPCRVRPKLLTSGPVGFLEVHDTARCLGPDEIERVNQDQVLATDPLHMHAWATATRLARGLGGELALDSTPGCGSQALLLFR